MAENKITFVIYTPYVGHNPKRMEEVVKRAESNKLPCIIVTPLDYTDKLTGQVSDTVHLVQLTPDTTTPEVETQAFFQELENLRNLVETIKYHNIQ